MSESDDLIAAVEFSATIGPRARLSARTIGELDPGIRAFVVVLDAAGIETFESCEGGEGHAFPEPTIRFYGDLGEGFRALAAALRTGPLPVQALRRVWDVDRAGEPSGPNWEITFRRRVRA